MSEAAAAGRQRRDETLFGWILALAFFVLLYNIISLPRTALEDRAALRAFHDSFGLVFIILSIWRLNWMVRRPGPVPPDGLPAASFAFNRAILVALYMTFVLTGVIGLFYGWGEFDREVVLFGLHLPSPYGENDAVRRLFGYLHSSLGFYYLFLIGVWLVFGLYQHLRYRAGLLRLLPGAKV
jgi:cytochrome b561